MVQLLVHMCLHGNLLEWLIDLVWLFLAMFRGLVLLGLVHLGHGNRVFPTSLLGMLVDVGIP